MGKNIVARNRKARHEYHIEETYEAGLVLKGTEVKSLRAGRVNIQDGYGFVDGGEVFIENVHISPFEQGNVHNVDPLRRRKLLLNKREILRITQKVTQEGYTLIPISIYFVRGRAKLEIAVARGKKMHDRREEIARRDAERRMRQAESQKY